MRPCRWLVALCDYLDPLCEVWPLLVLAAAAIAVIAALTRRVRREFDET